MNNSLTKKHRNYEKQNILIEICLAGSRSVCYVPHTRMGTNNNNNYIITANNSIQNAEIGIRDLTQTNETAGTLNFNPSDGVKTLTNVENCLITLLGKKCLPQILPLTFQNTTLQGTHYAIVKDVACGKDVRGGTLGDVIFDGNSDYTFETKGTFRLTKGVRVNLGAQLKVIPSEINY